MRLSFAWGVRGDVVQHMAPYVTYNLFLHQPTQRFWGNICWVSLAYIDEMSNSSWKLKHFIDCWILVHSVTLFAVFCKYFKHFTDRGKFIKLSPIISLFSIVETKYLSEQKPKSFSWHCQSKPLNTVTITVP